MDPFRVINSHKTLFILQGNRDSRNHERLFRIPQEYGIMMSLYRSGKGESKTTNDY